MDRPRQTLATDSCLPDHTMLNHKAGSIGPSDEGLVVNIIRFSRLLRENGISVTPSSVLDAIRSLELIDISRIGRFGSFILHSAHTSNPVLRGRLTKIGVFDSARAVFRLLILLEF